MLETHPPPCCTPAPQSLGGRGLRDGNGPEPGQRDHPHSKHCTVQPGRLHPIAWQPKHVAKHLKKTNKRKIFNMNNFENLSSTVCLFGVCLLPKLPLSVSETSWHLPLLFDFFRMLPLQPLDLHNCHCHHHHRRHHLHLHHRHHHHRIYCRDLRNHC